MRSHQDYHIHDLSPEVIVSILANDAWKTKDQSISSAKTNNTDLKEPDPHYAAIGENTDGINAFSDIKFDKDVKQIIDFGGGQFDSNLHYLKRAMNIDLLVWDPYNRSAAHNANVQAVAVKSKMDAVTSMSVLNVIPEATVRLAHIATLKAALKIGGQAYFKIWPGEGVLQGTYLPAATDFAFQANAYADRFMREIELVFGSGNVKLAKNTPNLIIAAKLTEAPTSKQDIVNLQKKSQQEFLLLTKVKKASFNRFYLENNVLKMFSTNFSFFKKMEDTWLEAHRHLDAKIQQEYDKRYGLILR